MPTERFPDTNALMDDPESIFLKSDKVYICGYVLQELDKHKESHIEDKKYKARRAGRMIEKYEDKIVYLINECSFNLPSYFDIGSMDNKIISVLNQLYDKNSNIVAISNDLYFRKKCNLLMIPCEKLNSGGNDELNYKGYKIVKMSQQEMSDHYSKPLNIFGLLNNEYLLIKDEDGLIVDQQRWNDEQGFLPLTTKGFNSKYLGELKPKDAFQIIAIDSLNNLDFTLLFGVAGSAKSLLSLSWIMQSIQTQKINKCVVIFNSVPLKNSQVQGYYPGDRDDKLLSTSLGGILSSKLGSMDMVKDLISNGKLLLIPTSEIRGIEISENDAIYVTEAQNIDSYTMRTILQRSKCKVIIEGDMLEQKDLRNVSSKDNGMLRAIEIFKGTKYFSCVKLKNTYRSPIAELAQKI